MNKKAEYAEGKKRMVRKLIAIGYDMNYDKPENEQEKMQARWQVCLQHVSRFFISDKSPLKKAVNDMTYVELTKAVTLFEKVKAQFFKRNY